VPLPRMREGAYRLFEMDDSVQDVNAILQNAVSNLSWSVAALTLELPLHPSGSLPAFGTALLATSIREFVAIPFGHCL